MLPDYDGNKYVKTHYGYPKTEEWDYVQLNDKQPRGYYDVDRDNEAGYPH